MIFTWLNDVEAAKLKHLQRLFKFLASKNHIKSSSKENSTITDVTGSALFTVYKTESLA